MNKHFLNKRLAHQLGFAGLVPFVLIAIASWLVATDWLGTFLVAQQAYAIVTLSFLGGIHWGATMLSGDLSAEKTKRALSWSIVPIIISCFVTMSNGPFRFVLLVVAFIACYQVDKRIFLWYQFPEWFIRLRFKLTCAVVAALMLTVIADSARG